MFTCFRLATLGLLAACSSSAMAETFTSYPTQLKTKVIYARAEGEVSKIHLREGQVFLWDEQAVTLMPSKNVRPEFGRANTEFAGHVSKILVAPGDHVAKGEPLVECRYLENVYTSCVVPASLKIAEDDPILAYHDGQTFDGKVLSTHTEGNQTYVNVLVYNTHQEKYWHLTHGLKLSLKFQAQGRTSAEAQTAQN